MSDAAPDLSGWPEVCHDDLGPAIAEFKAALPGWWYTLGECQVSCDASCAPTSLSADLDLIPADERFNSGFHADLAQPSTLADALRTVMQEALEAKEILVSQAPMSRPST